MKKTKTKLEYVITLDKIDLHGDTADIARYEVLELLRKNVNRVGYKVAIVHGVGTGILKAEVLNILNNNRHIVKYFMGNNGSTVVEFIETANTKIND